MPRKTTNEIFTVTRNYEPDRQAEVKALQIVLDASKKQLQKRQKIEKGAAS